MTRYDLFLISGNEFDYRLDSLFNQLKALVAVTEDIQVKEFVEDNASLHYRGVSKGSIQLIGYFDDDTTYPTTMPINRAGEDKINGVILLNMNVDVPNCLPASTTPVQIEDIADRINHAILYFNNIINKLKLKENE